MVSEQQVLLEDLKGGNVHASKGNDAQLCTHNRSAHLLTTPGLHSVISKDSVLRCMLLLCRMCTVLTTLPE